MSTYSTRAGRLNLDCVSSSEISLTAELTVRRNGFSPQKKFCGHATGALNGLLALREMAKWNKIMYSQHAKWTAGNMKIEQEKASRAHRKIGRWPYRYEIPVVQDKLKHEQHSIYVFTVGSVLVGANEVSSPSLGFMFATAFFRSVFVGGTSSIVRALRAREHLLVRFTSPIFLSTAWSLYLSRHPNFHLEHKWTAKILFRNLHFLSARECLFC